MILGLSALMVKFEIGTLKLKSCEGTVTVKNKSF
jgi:hypothetical protein